MFERQLGNRSAQLKAGGDKMLLSYRIKCSSSARVHNRHPQLLSFFHHVVSTSHLVDTSCISSLNIKRCVEGRAY